MKKNLTGTSLAGGSAWFIWEQRYTGDEAIESKQFKTAAEAICEASDR